MENNIYILSALSLLLIAFIPFSNTRTKNLILLSLFLIGITYFVALVNFPKIEYRQITLRLPQSKLLDTIYAYHPTPSHGQFKIQGEIKNTCQIELYHPPELRYRFAQINIKGKIDTTFSTDYYGEFVIVKINQPQHTEGIITIGAEIK
jgi:hypothetical protein